MKRMNDYINDDVLEDRCTKLNASREYFHHKFAFRSVLKHAGVAQPETIALIAHERILLNPLGPDRRYVTARELEDFLLGDGEASSSSRRQAIAAWASPFSEAATRDSSGNGVVSAKPSGCPTCPRSRSLNGSFPRGHSGWPSFPARATRSACSPAGCPGNPSPSSFAPCSELERQTR